MQGFALYYFGLYRMCLGGLHYLQGMTGAGDTFRSKNIGNTNL